MIETAAKAQRVRSTLGVFERSGFFFNLPGSLVESIETVCAILLLLLFLLLTNISCCVVCLGPL